MSNKTEGETTPRVLRRVPSDEGLGRISASMGRMEECFKESHALLYGKCTTQNMRVGSVSASGLRRPSDASDVGWWVLNEPDTGDGRRSPSPVPNASSEISCPAEFSSVRQRTGRSLSSAKEAVDDRIEVPLEVLRWRIRGELERYRYQGLARC
ncbi:unnamed protein product [Trypanosoma congolense IL3000]|uniref:WGS project CAEQ00000000 data, annotated contig 534 n=1 Tax=Trypanosoma congolense (strain IL3000) TaxID=1068625 RepID=F9WGR9_TRYCI|nr:unnamed protein product [Trypanosoma congolense IL3000]